MSRKIYIIIAVVLTVVLSVSTFFIIRIRKFRLARKLRQEDLAEKTDLTTNYIGMVERGEKIPSLETFIKIVNALGVSSDMVLTDVLETGYTVKNSMLNEKLEKLVPEDRNRIYEVIDTLVKQSKQILP